MVRLLLVFLACTLLSSSPCADNSAIFPQVLTRGDVAQPSAASDRTATEPRPVDRKIQLPLTPAALRWDPAISGADEVFGSQLFSGAFAHVGGGRYNPDYVISIGDRIHVRLWGGFELDVVLEVDDQGNVFLPHVGPVRIAGVRNADLQNQVEAAIRKVFRANVFTYSSLAEAQPVRVFVGGFVPRPGLYNGTSMDSLLHYLDQAGGIDSAKGSYLKVQVKRSGDTRVEVNLYDFLLEGRLPLIQFADGDVIFVPPRSSTVKVSGMAQNANRFEFSGPSITVGELVRIAKPHASATHVRVTRNTGAIRNVEYYPLLGAGEIIVNDRDELEFTADKKPGTITVRVEGEHLSPQEYVLPYGARFGDLIANVRFSDRSEADSLQLFRISVRERQRTMLSTALKSLESTVLTARSGTSDEARLRKDEADLILQWIERAKQAEPRGQVLIAQAEDRNNLLLENGDIIKVPTRDGLVLISGEVLFPNAIAYDSRLSLDDYIRHAGGYTQNADNSRVVIAHRDGSFDQGGEGARLKAGDEVLILPKVDVKSRQIWKDLTQIIYQIAISTRVIIGL